MSSADYKTQLVSEPYPRQTTIDRRSTTATAAAGSSIALLRRHQRIPATDEQTLAAQQPSQRLTSTQRLRHSSRRRPSHPHPGRKLVANPSSFERRHTAKRLQASRQAVHLGLVTFRRAAATLRPATRRHELYTRAATHRHRCGDLGQPLKPIRGTSGQPHGTESTVDSLQSFISSNTTQNRARQHTPRSRATEPPHAANRPADQPGDQ